MSNRRQFILASSGATLAMTGAGRAVGLERGTSERPADLYAVVYDERFDDSLAFARQARREGLAVRAIRGDVTALWYDDLYHRWKEGPAAIAGLTTPAALFCLETFGADAGLRRVLKVEHRPTAGGAIEHRLEGPATLLAQTGLEACGPAWSARMAQLAGRCPAVRKGRAEAVARSAVTGPTTGPTLVSWVLAPV